MDVQNGARSPELTRPVRVPRALRHSFPSRIGLPIITDGSPVVPAVARALSAWLAGGSVLVMAGSDTGDQSTLLATWLMTRPERTIWLDGAELRESGDALEAALDGLYELGALTRSERSAFTHLWDLGSAIQRESSPIILVASNAQFIPDIPPFRQLTGLASRWPNVRFAFVTDTVVDTDIGIEHGVAVLDATQPHNPPGTLEDLEPDKPHAEGVRVETIAGDRNATIFHLSHAGRHIEALDILAATPFLALGLPHRIEMVREAAAAIDVSDPGHSVSSLAARLQIATIPPIEPAQARDRIQDALTLAQNSVTSPLTAQVQTGVVLAHVSALIARGRFEEARALGLPLAESLLAMPWLDRREFGIDRILVWTEQATTEVLVGRAGDALRFARVAQEAALNADIPYALYMATAAIASIEARQGDLFAAEHHLCEAQKLYRTWGWPRSVAQTVEFVARYYLARATLDVESMIELRRDISALAEPSTSVVVLMKSCECFIHLHSGSATRARVAVRQLSGLVQDLRPAAVFRVLASEMAFEVSLRFGEAANAIAQLEEERRESPDAECVLPLLGAAHLALGDGARALSATDECAGVGSHHSLADYSLLLLVRAGSHQLLGNSVRADEYFEEALVTQEPSPMPYLFLMIPIQIRRSLWLRVPAEQQHGWMELRQFLGTVPESVGRPDETLPKNKLTTREMEILRALSIGGTLEEIAANQYVSRNTVKTHVRLIYRKLHVNTRADAALVMKRFGELLVEPQADDVGRNPAQNPSG